MPRSLLVIVNTLVLLALVEGAARVAERVHPGTDEVTFAYSPYRMLKMTHAPWGLNRDGFRAGELGTYRDSFLVEFLGGSVCLGVGENPGETVPERLEEALHQAGLARARVLNLCQGGAVSAQELAIFVEYGLPLHPQVVISFDGANDLMHPSPVGDDSEANLPYHNAQIEARVDGRDGLSHLALARVAGRIAQRFQEPGTTQGVPVEERAILDSYLYHLAAVRTLTEADHGLYAVAFQPTLHYSKPWNIEETAMWKARRPRDGEQLTKIIRERYGRAREGLIDWAAAGNVSLYDLSPAFSDASASVYSDSVHFHGPLGYAMLFSELARQGLIDRICQHYRDWEAGL